MAIPDSREGTIGVPRNSYYKGIDGKYRILIDTNNGPRWRVNGVEPGFPYTELKTVPADAPSSPTTGGNEKILASASFSEPLEKATKSSTIRYPSDIVFDSDTDYVLFQFGKYNPPFSQSAEAGLGLGSYAAYNNSLKDMEIQTISVNSVGGGSKQVKSIMLPMPQDLSNELKNDWQGKSFTRMGKAAISATAGGAFNTAFKAAGDLPGNLNALREALTTTVLNKIPGIGGNITANDISGSTRGVVINPNAEVLYDSPNLREIGMTFKMIPRNDTEAKIIKNICDAFRIASSPLYGGEGQLLTAGDDADPIPQDNFIRVPFLCKFTFMKGGGSHPWIAQFKPCAITRVQVNYTPDGTYATYSDGSPIATELSINFLESKLIYQQEINNGF